MLTDKPRIPFKQILLYGFLPSFLKVWVYRLKGYKIGKRVNIGPGAVVCGDEVQIGDCCSFGVFSVIRGRKIKIDAFVQIGAATIIDTPILEIGEGTKINEQVFVGGLQFPDSKLTIGRNCQIMQMSFINPSKYIKIGDDTGIGGHSLIFGHTSWLSAFEGYPVDFQPIEIGNSVSIAWRVFILPGSVIGDGAVVGANSLVNRVIPPRCLAVGFPAKVVAREPQFPVEMDDEAKPALLKNILSEMADYLRGFGYDCSQTDSGLEVVQKNCGWRVGQPKTWRVQVHFTKFPEKAGTEMLKPADLFLSLFSIPDAIRTHLGTRNTVWADIERKERSDTSNDIAEEVIQYLKRYGVRLFRDRVTTKATNPNV
jgi:acetyltransferase-like isoleucine patch superfamily enzyme